MRRLIFVIVLSYLICALCKWSVGAVDAPWPMFHRDLNRAGQSDKVGPRYIDIKWIADLGSGTSLNWASPTIDANGRTYIGTTNGVLHILSSSGVEVGSYNTGAIKSTSSSFSGATTPSAAVSPDGSIYVLDGLGFLHKLDSSGDFVWKHDLPGDTADSHPAVLSNGDVIVSTYDYVESPLGADGYLTSIKPDKTVNWTVSNPGLGHVMAGPAVDASGNIYVTAMSGQNNGKLIKYNSSGGFVWEYSGATDIANTPAIDPFGHVLFCDVSGYLLAVNRVSKLLDWQYRIGFNSKAAPAVTTDGLAVGLAYLDSAAGLDVQTGQPRWLLSTDGRARSGASLDKNDVAYFGLEGGMISAIDRRGKLVWSLNIGLNTRCTPAFDGDGNLYMATETSEGSKLICFSAAFDSAKTVAGAKTLGDGNLVNLPGKPVTYVGDGFFYIQDWDPVAGVRVVSTASVSVGDVVNVTGTMGQDGIERAIISPTVTPVGTCTLPVVRRMGNFAVGGGTVGANNGPTGGLGLNLVGVVVETFGKVQSVEGPSEDWYYDFWISDGATIPAEVGHTGIKVHSDTEPPSGMVRVRGVAVLEDVSGVGRVRKILTRSFEDIIDENY